MCCLAQHHCSSLLEKVASSLSNGALCDLVAVVKTASNCAFSIAGRVEGIVVLFLRGHIYFKIVGLAVDELGVLHQGDV